MYTHKNLMEPKRTKNRQMIPQHTKISDLDELKWNYDTIYKTGQIQEYWGEWATSRA